jgi:hypothetical protein
MAHHQAITVQENSKYTNTTSLSRLSPLAHKGTLKEYAKNAK